MKELGKTLALATAAVLAAAAVLAEVRPPAVPAEISIQVSPATTSPGAPVKVRLGLAPIEGVKINRYPKVKLEVPAQAGLVAAAQAAVGQDQPPAPDKMKSNYFDGFDGLELELLVDRGAAAGSHSVDGKLTYFYCMPASGFCAPHRVPVKIPLEVR